MNPHFQESPAGDAPLREHGRPGSQLYRVFGKYKFPPINADPSAIMPGKRSQHSALIQPKSQGERAFKTDTMAIHTKIA